MPPRRSTNSPPPQPPVLSTDQIRRRIQRLQGCISALKAFDPQTVTKRYNITEVVTLETEITDALASAFGNSTPRFKRYEDAARLDQGPHVARIPSDWGGGHVDYARRDAQEARQYLSEGKERSIKLLEQAIAALEHDIADNEPAPPPADPTPPAAQAVLSRKVFVVHGHDDGAREAVARFLEKIDFQPIILHEQANQGRTVIEKVEAHGDVGFAVVLLTPDDEGCVKGGTPQPRARQNVLLELGYFIGRLGRKHVCALKRGELEIPSDFGGVVYEAFDASGGWKQALGRELQSIGFDIDWNLVMRP
jgi:predicted nucleotide-binding protein